MCKHCVEGSKALPLVVGSVKFRCLDTQTHTHTHKHIHTHIHTVTNSKAKLDGEDPLPVHDFNEVVLYIP